MHIQLTLVSQCANSTLFVIWHKCVTKVSIGDQIVYLTIDG